MKDPQKNGFKELLELAKFRPPLTVAVVDAGETHVLQGIFEARDQGLLKPVLISRPQRIHKAAHGLGHSSVQEQSRPSVWVIPTNEEIVIARHTHQLTQKLFLDPDRPT
ncbi:hypothetical protein [Thiolapillus brandeum]|nr:hypothetical protein [Thiolapillus brandeum]